MKLNKSVIFITLAILLAAASRLIPHPLNFTPIAAIGLFGAAHLKPRWLAFLIPGLAMWISDLIIMNTIMAEFYSGFRWIGHSWVYIAFGAIVSLGFLLRGRVAFSTVLGASLTSSILFFLVTNFGVWLGSTFYPQNWAGLMTCYTAAIPFFWNTIAGDLFYCTVLFGSFALYSKSIIKPSESHVES